MKPFKVLKTERIIDEPYCCIDKERVVFPDGNEGDWFIKQNCDAVIIIPELKTGEILLERTYKHGCGEIIIEFPAGLIDPGETPKEAAIRELMEETGYRAETWTDLGSAYAGPTGSPMRHHYFLAKGCQHVQDPEPESAEQIEIVLAKDLAEARNIIDENPSSNTAYSALAMLK